MRAGASERALGELRDALGLDAVALYLPDPGGRPVLRLRRTCGGERPPPRVREELGFDREAWALAVASGGLLVVCGEASLLVANPFAPPAKHWLVLPLLDA